jgi:hypothetical protein
MPGPGIYLPDATQGVRRIEDLPAARSIQRSRNCPRRPCPKCQRNAYRLRTAQRTLYDLGDPRAGRPRDLHVTCSQHRCLHCGHDFNVDRLDLALPNRHYTHRVVATAVCRVVEDGLPYRSASWHLWRDHRILVPLATIQNWVEAAGEKRRTANRKRASRRGPEELQRLDRHR